MSGLVKYSVREHDLYDEHVLQAGVLVIRASDVARVVETLKAAVRDWDFALDEFENRVDALDDEDIIWLEGHRFRNEEAQRLLAELEGKG